MILNNDDYGKIATENELLKRQLKQSYLIIKYLLGLVSENNTIVIPADALVETEFELETFYDSNYCLIVREKVKEEVINCFLKLLS